MSNVADVTKLIEDQAREADAFRAKQIARIDALEKSATELEKRAGRPFAPDGAGNAPAAGQRENWIDTKTGKAVPVLKHSDSLAALEAKPENAPSLGRLLRGICLGGAAPDAEALANERKSMNIFADTTGGYTVSDSLAAQWIDLLRAQMVLSRAGAVTLPMEAGQVNIARVTADPTVSWHGESAAITATAPTFGRVTLAAKTCVCLVKFSLELAQDSANMESQLAAVVTNAMAAAIDSAGLNGVSTDAAAAPAGVMNLTDRNTVTSIGAPTSWNFLLDGMYELMLDNVAQGNIGAFIAHPAVWKKMAKLKTGIASDLTTLVQPPEVAKIPKLYTTAAPLVSGTTAAGIIADWRDLVFGVRKNITVRVLSETYMGSNLELAIIAYARVDFAATRPTSFCTLEGITV